MKLSIKNIVMRMLCTQYVCTDNLIHIDLSYYQNTFTTDNNVENIYYMAI